MWKKCRYNQSAELSHQNALAGSGDGGTGGGGGEVEREGGEGEESEERGEPALGHKLPDVVVCGVVTEDRVNEMDLWRRIHTHRMRIVRRKKNLSWKILRET